jgi:hypothetical protein
VTARDERLAILLLALSAALAVEAVAAYLLLSSGNDDSFTVWTAEPQREAYTTYLLGYLLPVILVDLNDSSAVIAVIVFVALLGLVYVRSNLVYLNPLLALAGFRLFTATGCLDLGPSRPVSMLVLARRRHLPRGERLLVTGSEPDIRFVRGSA